MGLIGNILERARERKRMQQGYEDNDRIVSNFETKKLSHNERELIKVLEKERQKSIKEALILEEKKRILLEKENARNFMKFERSHFLNGGNW